MSSQIATEKQSQAQNQAQKKDWREINEEDQSFEPKQEVEEIKRIKEEKNQKGEVISTSEETVQLHKRIFPVRKCVKERKNMKKFGEAKNEVRGTKLPVNEGAMIETLDSETQQEIELVTKIQKINTQNIKERKILEDKQRLEEESKNPEKALQKAAALEQAQETKKEDKLKNWAEKAMTQNQYDDKKMSLKITNIVLDSDLPSDQSEIAFKKYVEDIIKTNYPNEKVKFSIRIFPNKKTNDGMARAYLNIDNQQILARIQDKLNDQTYNYANLMVEQVPATFKKFNQ